MNTDIQRLKELYKELNSVNKEILFIKKKLKKDSYAKQNEQKEIMNDIIQEIHRDIKEILTYIKQ